MAAEIVNLRQARKSRDRAEKEKRAEANRAKFGRSKGEKIRQERHSETDAQHLDGHRLEKPDGGDAGN